MSIDGIHFIIRMSSTLDPKSPTQIVIADLRLFLVNQREILNVHCVLPLVYFMSCIDLKYDKMHCEVM